VRGLTKGGIVKMLDRGTETVRLQCGSCGAHALMTSVDYSELVDHADAHMRCEVCGVWARFEPAARPAGDRRALTLR